MRIADDPYVCCIHTEKEDAVLALTLSELIDACGDRSHPFCITPPAATMVTVAAAPAAFITVCPAGV